MNGEWERIAKREKQPLEEADLQKLWIFAPSASPHLLSQLDYKPDLEHWEPGIYFSGPLLKVAFVAINQLPETPDTFWIRLMGRGKTQKQAIAETIDLPDTSPFRDQALLTQFGRQDADTETD